MRRAVLPALLVAFLVPGVALASRDWSDLQAAFPAFPCADGWMACRVGGTTIDPDLRQNGRGLPTPADLRVDFYTFEATPVFSPFSGLSDYPQPPVASRSDAPPVAALDTDAEPPEQSTEPVASPEPIRERVLEPVAIEVHQPTSDPAPVGQPDCATPAKLEPQAMLGKLTADQVACVERAYSDAARQTTKDKLSRLLMADAWGKGDHQQWDRLVQRHLDEVDQSDPDIAYKYAQYLVRKGSSRNAIRWADVALERRTVWTGDQYKDRVSTLYRLRAAAAQELWKSAEQQVASTPTDAARQQADEARNLTKVYAREWYEYAVASNRDGTQARMLCESAAGTADYCRGG